jgi:hypothetical protein
VKSEAAGRSIQSLEAARDQALVRVQLARKRGDDGDR